MSRVGRNVGQLGDMRNDYSCNLEVTIAEL